MSYAAIIVCSCVGFILGFIVCNSIRWRKLNNAIREIEYMSKGMRKAVKKAKK